MCECVTVTLTADDDDDDDDSCVLQAGLTFDSERNPMIGEPERMRYDRVMVISCDIM